MDYIEYTNETNDLNESIEDLLLTENEISDRELQKIYKYHLYGGYKNIKFLEILNLASTIFMIFFIQIIFRCIDYEGLGQIDNFANVASQNQEHYLWDFIHINKIWKGSFFNVCFMIIFGFYIILRILTILDGLKQYREIKLFLENRLNITESDIKKIKWKEVSTKLETFLQLNSYELHAKMLRKENIMIHIFDSQINKFIFSKLMEWNLTFCIINPILSNLNHQNLEYYGLEDNRGGGYGEGRGGGYGGGDGDGDGGESEFLDTSRQVPKDNQIKFLRKDRLKQKCTRNLVILGFLTYIFMPFLIIYSFFYSFLKHAERYYQDPSKIILRHWSLGSRWKIRYYNELPHLLEFRLDTSSKYARQYLGTFQNLGKKYILNFILLVCSSLFISLIILSVYNENILLHLHISRDKHVLWYLGILGSIIALAKNLERNKSHLQFETDIYFRKIESILPLINQRSYNISVDRLNLDMEKKNKLCRSYVYQFKTLLLECFSVLWVPFCLIYLANYVENIIERVEKIINYDSRIGYICKSSNFRSVSKNSNLKTLYSFKEFRNKFPHWGANIEIYKIGNISFLQPDIKTYNEEKNRKDVLHKYTESVFENSINSGLSIL